MGKPISNYDLNLKLERTLTHLHELRSELSQIKLYMRGIDADTVGMRESIARISDSLAEAESVVICKTPEPELIG